MATQNFNLNDNDLLKQVYRAAFPDYNGRKFKVKWGVKAMSLVSYWSGGSRDYFVILNLATMRCGQVGDAHPFFNQENYNDLKSVQIPEGFVVVEHSIFLGKDMGLTIHTSYEAPALESGKDSDLTEDMAMLLIVTAGLKSSYAGYNDLRKRALIKTLDWSGEKVDELRLAAIEAGYMHKNNALSNEGKNVISGHAKRNQYWNY